MRLTTGAIANDNTARIAMSADGTTIAVAVRRNDKGVVIGLFGCLELVKNRKTKEPMAPYVGGSPEMAKLGAYLKDNGVYNFTWSNMLHTNPPLTVTESELREVFEIINKALAITDQAVTG